MAHYRVEQTEDHLWTLQKKAKNGKWVGEKDFLSLQAACEAYHEVRLAELVEELEVRVTCIPPDPITEYVQIDTIWEVVEGHLED